MFQPSLVIFEKELSRRDETIERRVSRISSRSSQRPWVIRIPRVLASHDFSPSHPLDALGWRLCSVVLTRRSVLAIGNGRELAVTPTTPQGEIVATSFASRCPGPFLFTYAIPSNLYTEGWLLSFLNYRDIPSQRCHPEPIMFADSARWYQNGDFNPRLWGARRRTRGFVAQSVFKQRLRRSLRFVNIRKRVD